VSCHRALRARLAWLAGSRTTRSPDRSSHGILWRSNQPALAGLSLTRAGELFEWPVAFESPLYRTSALLAASIAKLTWLLSTTPHVAKIALDQ
jgi:hypothetical protein